MVLTLVTSGVTYLIQPIVYHQFEKAGQAQPERSGSIPTRPGRQQDSGAERQGQHDHFLF